MISCRTQYKSYREKNTHISTLIHYGSALRFAPLVRRTYARCVSIDGGARLKERSHYGSGSSVGLATRTCSYTIFSSVQWWAI
jgi:hypothetical protein